MVAQIAGQIQGDGDGRYLSGVSIGDQIPEVPIGANEGVTWFALAQWHARSSNPFFDLGGLYG